MDWTIIISSIGGSAVLFMALAFLVRSVIVHFLNKDVENFKNALALKTLEHQIRFESLHNKRAEIIAEFYQKLVVANAALTVLKGYSEQTFSRDKNSINDAFVACIDAFRFFQFNELYFDEEFCGKVKRFHLQFFSKVGLHEGLSRMWNDLKIEHPELPEERKKWIEEALVSGWKTFTEEIPVLLNELKTHFRETLGVVPEIAPT